MWKNRAYAIALLAFLIRVALGGFALVYLPTLPTGSEPQKAGYLFYDAFHRDSQAWELAASGESLFSAFSEKRSSDQYGGLLFILSALYRAIPVGTHFPMLTILLSALVAALGVLAFIAMAKEFLPEKAALLLGVLFATYPESVLLGASQMREPYLISLVAVFLYGMVLAGKGTALKGYSITLAALIGTILVSPGIALPLILIAAGWFSFGALKHGLPVKKITLTLLILIILGIIALGIISSSWESVVSYKGGGVLGVLGEWAKRTAQYNAYLLKQSSGIVQVMLGALPSWLAFPFVAIYGLLQPVLPAVLFEPGEGFWKVIGFLRAVGWYTLLPLLMVFPFALKTAPAGTKRSQWYWLFLVAVVWLFVSSLRGGGDQWDNPRYRTILLPALMLLATILLAQLDLNGKVWLKRIFAIEAFDLLLFCHWYSWRYTGWGFDLGIRNTILLAIAGSLLLLFIIKKPKPTGL